VLREVKAQAWRYYHLVVNPGTAKVIAESAQHGVVAALDIYESFYYVQRRPKLAPKDDRIHFSKFAPDQVSINEGDISEQIPAQCTCKTASGAVSGLYVSILLCWLTYSAQNTKYRRNSSRGQRRCAKRLIQSGIRPALNGNS
jgi:hypothetical protein